MNTLKTVFLMTAMMLLFLFVGNLIGGQQGMMFAFVFSLLMNFGSYWFSDKIVLKMYGAQQVSRDEYPRLFAVVENLARRASLPMPAVYVMDNPTPNAFATGRNPEHSAVAVTTGILNLLDEDELSGVIGHELSHIAHRDILIGTITATMVGTINMIANMAGWAMMMGSNRDDRDGDDSSGFASIFLMLLSPIIAMLIQMAISRSREFLADEGGAAISGNANSLASALNKLNTINERLPMGNAQPSSAHLFIVNPLSGRSFMKLFSTHPPIEERVARLKEIAAKQGQAVM